MASEEEESSEFLSASFGNEVHPRSSEFLEYHVPLEDSIGISQRERTYKSEIDGMNENGNHHVEEFDTAGEEPSEHYLDNTDSNIQNHDNKNDNVLPAVENQKQHPGYTYRRRNHEELIGTTPPRKGSGDAIVNDQNRTMIKERNHASPTKQIRMDGNVNVIRNAHSNSSRTASPIPGSVSVTPTSIDPAQAEGVGESRETSYTGSRQGAVDNLDGEFSFKSNTSKSYVTFQPNSSQNNNSISSNEGTSQMKPSSYNQDIIVPAYNANRTRVSDQNVVVQEENAAAGNLFDESEEENASGTRLTCARRVKDLFNLHKMSIIIVKWIHYVCFSCFRNKNELQASTYPDRLILARLNILSFFFSVMQLVGCLWLIAVLFVAGEVYARNGEAQDADIQDNSEQYEFYLWNNNGSIVVIGCLAFVLMCTCFWTTRIVKEVDLVGALRFLWLLLWILPVVAFLNITAFDQHNVTKIWIRHNWDSIQLWWFRQHTCSLGTADTLCMVPIEGGDEYVYEEQWCLDLYNSTNCTEIRDEAQKKTNSILLIFYRFLASWGCVYMFFMLLIIKALERIISKPMVQKSREVNVVGWLTFPVFCTALFGSIILFAPYTTLYEVVETRWLGYLYLIASSLFFIALLMGWFLSAFSIRSNIDKQNKAKAALVLVMVLFINAFVLLTIMIASYVWSRNLKLSPFERGEIACAMNNNQCTGCLNDIDAFRCPEWSYDEILNIVRRQLIQSSVMGAVFILYDVNVMIHALNVRKHLSMYQIDYV